MKNLRDIWETKKGKLIILAVIVLLVIFILIIAIVAMSGKFKSIFKPKPLNQKVNLETVVESIQRINRMNYQTTGLEDVSEYFGEYEYLEKKALVMTNEEKVNEVWLIKLTSYEQQELIARMLGNRINKLKQTFENNNEQLEIINKAIIKQEDGIVIMIISPYIYEIENVISTEMDK